MTNLQVDSSSADQAVGAFADCVRRYCHWARQPGADSRQEAETALALLSELLHRALSLPRREWQDNPDDIDPGEWKAMFRRFASLPFQYYNSSTSPAEIDGGGEVGDLHDDLADIWRDLASGLNLFDRGQVDAAVHYWRNFYWIHWGAHATAALPALHAWLADQRGYNE